MIENDIKFIRTSIKIAEKDCTGIFIKDSKYIWISYRIDKTDTGYEISTQHY